MRRFPSESARGCAPGAVGSARRVFPGSIILLGALLGGCLSYSPHELPTSEREIHRENLAELEAGAAAEPLRFAVLGDVQRAFDETSTAVDRLNALDDLAFVVQVGDFTDQGLLYEFDLMNELFERLRMPYFVVVGNHDLLGNGDRIYESFFGPRNYDFTFQRTRLVFLDTNSREYGFGERAPDLAWLGPRIAPGPDHDRVVIFSHVWPWSDDFDPALRDPFLDQLGDADVVASFHGHDHTYRTRSHDGVQYVIADSAANRTFLVVTLLPSGELDVQRVPF